MIDTLKMFEENLEGLEQFLESNRLNGFMDLDLKARSFILEYVQTHNRNAAAQAVDISKDQGTRILQDPLGREFLKYVQGKRQHYSLVNAAFIEIQQLDLLTKLLGEEEVPMVDKDGRPYQAKKFHSSEAVALLRDMSKSAGLIDDTRIKINNVNNTSSSATNVELTDDQKKILDQVLDGKF